MRIFNYDRIKAVNYAEKWAYSRNPSYYDFSIIGGDCTNFASQCLYAGAPIMNNLNTLGWYYRSAGDRAPSWTGVEYFYNFLIDNEQGVGSGVGPFAKEVSLEQIKIGDFIQLGYASGDFYHTPIVVGFLGDEPLLSAHSYDTFNRKLSEYNYDIIRCIHVLGYRNY